MNSNKKTTIMLITSSLVLVLLITIGLSFAYFTANIDGEEAGETITVTGGRMKIIYDTTDRNINISNVVPQDGVIATKEFTLIGDSTTNQDMLYQIHLVIVNNGFTDNAIQYKLTSVNDEDENGKVAPSITELKGIPTGENQEVFLGNATFESPADFNVHTYTLEFYFPRGEVAENENQGKTLESYVSVREGHRPRLLTEALLAEYGGIDAIEEAPTDLFASINTEEENVIYKMKDDYDDSYYLRGAKNHLNNNLIFAEHQWKIVRINGDGSIRIIYNGTCPGNSCTINTTGSSTQIGTTDFNSGYNHNRVVGYMYGSTSVPHTNDYNSTIKNYLDNWYSSNILNTDYENYVVDTLFCADRECHSGGCTGTNNSDYKAYYRLDTNKNPSLKCMQQNDRFTVTDTEIGNGALDYPIGLLTADEAAMAGLLFGTGNSTNYLYTNKSFWLMSPSRFSSHARESHVDSTGDISNYAVNSTRGARGVLNLKSDTTATGTGTTSDPYIVN